MLVELGVDTVLRPESFDRAELRRLRILLWVGCGIGALVAALMVVQVLGP